MWLFSLDNLELSVDLAVMMDKDGWWCEWWHFNAVCFCGKVLLKFFPQMHTDHTHTASKSALPLQIRVDRGRICWMFALICILVAGVCCWALLNLFSTAIFDLTHVGYSWEFWFLVLWKGQIKVNSVHFPCLIPVWSLLTEKDVNNASD